MVPDNMPSRTSDKAGEREATRSEYKERRRHHHHHRSSRSKRTTLKEGVENAATGEDEPGSNTASDAPGRKLSADVPELYGRGSPSSPMGSRSSLPYPSFSKAHSREAVSSRDDLGTPTKKNIFTPDPTDLQPAVAAVSPVEPKAPPSPPLTADGQAYDFGGRKAADGKHNLDVEKDPEAGSVHAPNKGKSVTEDRVTESSRLERNPLRSESSASPMRKTRSMTPIKGMPMPATVDDGSTVLSGHRRTKSISPASSNRTSIAPQQPKLQAPYSPKQVRKSSVEEQFQSPPKTPTPRGTPAPPFQILNSGMNSLSIFEESPIPPPPPPPPPVVPGDVQRVDYLLQHGGLSRPVTKHYLSAPDGHEGVGFTVGELPDPTAMAKQVDKFFSPFSRLLDDYAKVISKNGSIAVATGYKSIARRLLGRLEAVFARNISSESCGCVLCTTEADSQASEADTGVSWGEILEYVSGRQEMPPWPPLTLHNTQPSFGIATMEFKAPMQKLDIDVPDEYREHYIRQSKKTKQSVDRWLAGQTDAVAPPDEADDDTLTFAILTHLTSDERRLFSQMAGLPSSRPPSVSLEAQGSLHPSPLHQDLLTQTGIAIQRLYRLSSKPRHPECALFLLRNLGLHGVLATLAAISDAEWGILISGRFDGFLISGAEDLVSPGLISPLASRGPTPAGPRRSTGLSSSTASGISSTGAPVALDEETEIATLAEVEREIFLGMETLEDAFEALHTRAETIRRTLRERAAGLSMQAQVRKGAAAMVIEARLGTPASQRGFDSETDDGMDDTASELAPDDSASNISRSRMRRPRRRTERRTPAPVEECDEEQDDGGRGVRNSHAQPADVNTPSRNTLRKR